MEFLPEDRTTPSDGVRNPNRFTRGKEDPLPLAHDNLSLHLHFPFPTLDESTKATGSVNISAPPGGVGLRQFSQL